MRQRRNQFEIVLDEALTLSLMAEVERVPGGKRTDRIRLQKLVYWVANSWFEQRLKGFNYNYYRYQNGPFTKDLYQTEKDLAVAGYLKASGAWSIDLTDSGRSIAYSLIEDVWTQGNNKPFWDDIAASVRDLGKLSTPDLIQRVYDLRVVPIGWPVSARVADIPIYVDLIQCLDAEESTRMIEIPQVWTALMEQAIAEPTSTVLPGGITEEPLTASERELLIDTLVGTQAIEGIDLDRRVAAALIDRAFDQPIITIR